MGFVVVDPLLILLATVISEKILRSLNDSGQAKAVALDISKAFDKVWHAGLLKKLQSYMEWLVLPMLDLISSFLSDRKIKVTLDGQSSSDFSINAGVPQGSVLGPTPFLLFINDLPDHVISQLAIYADGSTLYLCLTDKTDDLFDMVELAANLEYDLRSTVEWGKKWFVSFNNSKSFFPLIVSVLHLVRTCPLLCLNQSGKTPN